MQARYSYLTLFTKFSQTKTCETFKVTRHLCFENSKYLQPQDILAFISANKTSFQNPKNSLFHLAERLFVGF